MNELEKSESMVGGGAQGSLGETKQSLDVTVDVSPEARLINTLRGLHDLSSDGKIPSPAELLKRYKVCLDLILADESFASETADVHSYGIGVIEEAIATLDRITASQDVIAREVKELRKRGRDNEDIKNVLMATYKFGSIPDAVYSKSDKPLRELVIKYFLEATNGGK